MDGIDTVTAVLNILLSSGVKPRVPLWPLYNAFRKLQ